MLWNILLCTIPIKSVFSSQILVLDCFYADLAYSGLLTCLVKQVGLCRLLSGPIYQEIDRTSINNTHFNRPIYAANDTSGQVDVEKIV